MSETVLITGASSGIGLELAKRFAALKNNLILVARSEKKLEDLRRELADQHNVQVDVIVADLAKVDAAKQLAAELVTRNLMVDVLINNAGFGELGRFAEIDMERQIDMVRLNVVTVVQLTRLLLPDMLKRGNGGIINVGSTAAFQPGPNMAVYYATKAFVLSFSDAIHEELIDTDIKVVCLAPGPTTTGFAEDSGMKSLKMFSANAMDVGVVADAAITAYQSNRALVIPGIKNKIGAFMNRLVPRIVVRKLVKKLQSTGKS